MNNRDCTVPSLVSMEEICTKVINKNKMEHCMIFAWIVAVLPHVICGQEMGMVSTDPSHLSEAIGKMTSYLHIFSCES